MRSIINSIGWILAIPFAIILIIAGYYTGEWVLNGFQDIKEENRKKRNPLQVIAITVFGIIAIYLFLSLFKGCGDDSELYNGRRV